MRKRYLMLLGVAVLGAATTIGTALAIEDRRDRAMTAGLDATQSELLGIGAQITSIKDANLTTPNDFIAAYAQVEPLEKAYDEKLDKFAKLYNAARERDSHRSLFDLQRYRGTHHPESWERMSEIIGLVREINEVTKRQISVVHAMASLPEPERMRFWHEQFMPLAAQEHALREQLQVVGQGRAPGSSVQ
ncbi:MAG TPA: hypothetical protein VFN26_23690 [Candidatus Acidoferrum sp.]|nr:hypothetical protein [Candidatus Acidoferrum sp.]